MSESFWMGLQSDYDIEQARHNIGRKLKRIPSYAA